MRPVGSVRHRPFSLILSGGGGRGMAHVGVLRALGHAGLWPSAIVGVSMGAIVGASYALNPLWYPMLVSLDTSEFPRPIQRRPNGDLRERVRSLLSSERALLNMLVGWGVGERAVDFGRRLLHDLTGGRRLEEGRIPIAVIASDLCSGRRVVIESGDAVDAVYASAALPGVLPPLQRGQQMLADGSYTDDAPIDVARRLCDGPVIAIDVSQTDDCCEIDNGFQAMLRAMEICHHTHAQMRFAAADFVVRPEFPFMINVLDFDHKRTCIAVGIESIRRQLPAIHRLLSMEAVQGYEGAREEARVRMEESE